MQNSNICPVWMTYMFDNPVRKLIHPADSMLKKYIKPGMKTADIGCGSGYFSLAVAKLLKNNGNVYAVDIQQKMLDIMMKRAQYNNLNNVITPILCDDSNFHLPPDLDFIIASWVLHETKDVQQSLNQIHDALKPDAIFYWLEPGIFVNKQKFTKAITYALKLGFVIISQPEFGLDSRIVLKK